MLANKQRETLVYLYQLCELTQANNFYRAYHFELSLNVYQSLQSLHYLKDEYFFLGGIFNDTGCAIVTIESEGILRNIHHRRPVFFSKDSLEFWLSGQDEELFECNSPNRLGIHLVSKKVNSGIVNDKELVEAIKQRE